MSFMLQDADDAPRPDAPAGQWAAIAEDKSEIWARRAAFVAERLGAVDGVADMGCGLMTLERYLAPGTLYVPVDLVARDERTIVCDFNSEPPPATGMPAATCLGLLGYLDDPERFLSALADLHQIAFVTYKATDAPGARADRRAMGMRTDFSTAAMEQMLVRTGWTIASSHHGQFPMQAMWLLAK
jgi:hypothetical protein